MSDYKPPFHMTDNIHNLFARYQHSEFHPLIKSAVFHYEFVFIHPFADGNITQRHRQKAAQQRQTALYKNLVEICIVPGKNS